MDSGQNFGHFDSFNDHKSGAPTADGPLQGELSRSSLKTGARRAKSSLRIKYEAEIHVIERKLGDLESIREKLGLTQRKMAQLLLVDPSAWTRWTKCEAAAPPHIYRMLQWYLALEDKYPALDVNFWLNTVSQVSEKRLDSETTRAEQRASTARVEALEKSNLLTNTTTTARFCALEVELERRLQMPSPPARRQSSSSRLNLVWCSVALLAGTSIGFLISHFVF